MLQRRAANAAALCVSVSYGGVYVQHCAGRKCRQSHVKAHAIAVEGVTVGVVRGLALLFL
eukprot:scaffold13199_cov98-Isochrysis_galbana.AAC.3